MAMSLGVFLKFFEENLENGVVAFATPGPDGGWS